MKEELKGWLISQQSSLDLIIATAAQTFYDDNHNNANFQYDLKQCHIESYNLIKGKDLCYDRPNTAFAYSLWYHPRRINTFLTFFIDEIINFQGKSFEVFDLGAGTGAIQWSLGLIYVGMKRLGIKPPQITLINIDTSPIMLSYSKEYLWNEFLKYYPEIDSSFKVEYEVNSWNNEQNIVASNPILAASYLFDDSDNQSEITNDFLKIINQYKPNIVLLLTSDQKSKKYFPDLMTEFSDIGYIHHRIDEAKLLFNEPLNTINALRTHYGKELNINELSRAASWTDFSYSAAVFRKIKSTINLDFGGTIPHLDIFNPPIIVRKEVNLNDKQIKAAKNTQMPAVIVGPAGCGKSIVITEKIKNIIEDHKYDKELKMLVTTFNKGLIGKLAEWLKDILDQSKYSIRYDTGFNGFTEKSSHFTFNDSSITNIRLLHFDMLPKQLAGVRYRGLVNIQEHIKSLDLIIASIKEKEKINDNQFDNILNPDFLLEEYHRVIYGLQVGITEGEENYMNIKRKGRGNNPSLQKNSIRRKLVFKCLKEYALLMHRSGMQSFTLRRQYLYAKLKSGEYKPDYDYILVDEFQDCTEADFDIFFSMIKDPNNFTIAGDLAQSIHLGTAARIPRDERMSKRQFHRLSGSYRLPVRISECIKKLSEAIVQRFGNDEGVTDITPYKGSPPGARPIVVYGKSYLELATKVISIFKTYKVYDLNRITILEKHLSLSLELEKNGILAETDTILSLKGLEKECVLWLTEIPLEFEKEVFEFAYTILTRTSCILIIALTENTQNIYKQVLGLLEKQRIILWDSESEKYFEAYSEGYEPITIEDEE